MPGGLPGRPEEPYGRNEMSGNVHGPSIQAQQIHGGITFNVPMAAPCSHGAEDTPDQIPPLTVRCVNRVSELASLDRDLGCVREGSPRVGFGVLSGIPGIGKTTLACSWSDRVRDQFPDGQLFVDYAALRGQTGGDVSAALAMCLQALGVRDDYLPRSLAERASLFRTRTAGRRVLVVLDDVGRPAQVTPLVPKGPGSMLLVTSNSRLGELALDGARLLSLEPLDLAGGLGLLADRCGEEAVAAEREAAERIVGFCAGLPKALQLAAARLLTNRRLTMGSLAEELADEAQRLRGLSLRGEHSVSAVLELSYRALPPDAARLYRVLGWLPGRTFDAGTAAIAADLDASTAESSLGALEESSLVEVVKDGRFRLHDLVRLHARERAAMEEPAELQGVVVERVATRYLALTAFADRAVREDRLRVAELTEFLTGVSNPFAAEGGPDPVAWLDAERTDILAVLREASRWGLWKHVWQLAESFTVLFLHRRYLGDWKESLELGATAAAEVMVPAAEARLRSLLSRPLMDLGEHDRARGELEKAVACAEVADHPALIGSVQEFFGRYWDRHDPARAMAAYRRSVECNIQAGEWRGVAIATYFLGCAQDAAGHHRKALDTLGRAHRDLTARHDARMAARALAAIGTVHEHLGDPEAAVRALSDAAQVLRAEKASHYEAVALVRLADIIERTHDSRASVREYLARALQIYESGGSPVAERLRERLDRLAGPDEEGDRTDGAG